MGKSTFQSLFEVFVYHTESNVSILPFIRLIEMVWVNVAGEQQGKWLWKL